MPARKTAVDVFVNRAMATITMSAADTLTFEQLRFAVGTFQGVALVIHRIEWTMLVATCRSLVAATDNLDMALVTNDNLTAIDPTDQDVLATMSVVPVATTVAPHYRPLVSEFSDLPGGGLIVPANPIFLAMDTGGFAAAGAARVVIYYTFKQLADKDYIELVQMMIPGNI